MPKVENDLRQLRDLSVSVIQVYDWSEKDRDKNEPYYYFKGVHRALDVFTFDMYFSGSGGSEKVLTKDLDALYEDKRDKENDVFAKGYTDVAEALRRRYDSPEAVAEALDPVTWGDE